MEVKRISKNFLRGPQPLSWLPVTFLSALPATTAFAATGDVGTISFTRTYDSDGNIMRYNSSAVINGYTAGGTGSIKYRMYVDGSNAFCLQPGVPLKTGNTLKESSSDTWNALSASIARIKADLTQERLAEAVAISPTHLSNIETGTTRVSLTVIVNRPMRFPLRWMTFFATA